MWIAITSFIASRTGKFIIAAICVITVLTFAWSAWSNYVKGVENAERLRNQAVQLEQVVRDNQAFQQRTQQLEEANRNILTELGQRNQEVQVAHEQVQTYLQSNQAQASNRESSDVIRNTIRMLRREEDQ